MSTPYIVCKKILEIGKKRDVQDITPLKLIKLAYISHGFHLGYTDKPLFEDDAEAWRYGPVVPRIYYAVSHYRKRPINPALLDHVDDPIENDSVKIIQAVMATYDKFSGTYLSALTHKEGTPWDITIKRAGEDSIIPVSLIRRHYKRVIDDHAAA